jgi:hypothetical protein
VSFVAGTAGAELATVERFATVLMRHTGGSRQDSAIVQQSRASEPNLHIESTRHRNSRFPYV